MNGMLCVFAHIFICFQSSIRPERGVYWTRCARYGLFHIAIWGLWALRVRAKRLKFDGKPLCIVGTWHFMACLRISKRNVRKHTMWRSYGCKFVCVLDWTWLCRSPKLPFFSCGRAIDKRSIQLTTALFHLWPKKSLFSIFIRFISQTLSPPTSVLRSASTTTLICIISTGTQNH